MRGTGKTLVAVEFMPPSATATATAICLVGCWHNGIGHCYCYCYGYLLGSGEDARGRGISRLAPVLEKVKNSWSQ